MSEFSKGFSRVFIVSSFLLIVGVVLFFSYFAWAVAVGGSHEGGSNGFPAGAMAIFVLFDLLIIIVLALLHRFLWRIKIH